MISQTTERLACICVVHCYIIFGFTNVASQLRSSRVEPVSGCTCHSLLPWVRTSSFLAQSVDLAAQQPAMLVAMVEVRFDAAQQLRAVVQVAQHHVDVFVRRGVGLFKFFPRLRDLVQPVGRSRSVGPAGRCTAQY